MDIDDIWDDEEDIRPYIKEDPTEGKKAMSRALDVVTLSGTDYDAMQDEIDRLRKICISAKEALYSGSKDDLEVADMLEAAFLKPNAEITGRPTA